MHRIAGRPSSSLPRRICVLVLLFLLPVLLCCARERESTISVREMRRTMMNSSSSPPLTSAAAARAKALGSTGSRAASVPGLPDLPDADAPLQSVQEDAAAAIRALRSAVDYGGRKKVPSREPVWRRGLPSHGGAGAAAEAAAASVATTAAAAATARADGGGRGSTAIPAGIVVEEYEVLSEERERVVGGQRSRERLWVPLTVARPAASISEEASPSPSSSYPALFLLHSTAGSRAKTRARLLRAAERGYVALAPEFRYFGTRGRLWEPFCPGKGTGREGGACPADNPEAPAAAGSDAAAAVTAAAAATPADFALYESELVRSFRSDGAEEQERPFLIDNCWDLQRVLDWLFFVGTDEKVEGGKEGNGGGGDGERRRRRTKLFNVDPARVGTTGISLGGMHSVLLGVLEQDRIAAMAPAIGVPTFAWGAAHGGEWRPRAASIPRVFDVTAAAAGLKEPTAEVYVRVLNAVAPGLLGPYDASRALAALAPRPLLIANGALDGRNPLGGVDMAVTRAQRVYDAASKSENLEYFVDDAAEHEYTPALEDKVDAWLDRWLLR